MSYPLPDLMPPPKKKPVLPRIHSKRILVIEDDHFMLPLISRALAHLDPDIVLDWATNAEDARSALASGRYTAVLADFMLEDSDSGFSLFGDCRELQPSARFAMMSALPISLPEGAFGLLRKPFNVEECGDFLDRLLSDAD